MSEAAAIRRPWLWAAAIVLLAAFAVHGGSLSGGFVYDDHRFIEANEAIRSVPLVSAFADPATASHGEGVQHDIYRPLRTILFSIEYALFGLDATWWHLVSVLLHALNAVLVLRLLRPLLRGALLPSAVGALLFVVHPVTSESVAWISSQGDLLAMTLALVSLILLERRGTGRTLVGAACFALACLAKESALVLPLILILRDAALPRDQSDAPSPWRRLSLQRAGVLAAVAALYFVLRGGVMEGGLAQVEHAGGSVWASVRAMLAASLWYAGALLWPAGFSFGTRIDVPVRWTDPEVIAGLGLVVTTLAAGIWALRSKRYVLALALLGFLISLGPVSNVIIPLKTFAADRFLYPGLVFVAVAVAVGVKALRGTALHATATVLVCVLVMFGYLTVQRNAAWASDFELWDAVRRDRPSNTEAYQGLAFEYAKRKEVSLAERAYAPYLEANPLDGKSLRNLGDLFGELADSLVMTDREFEKTTSLPLRRKQARVAQLQLYRRALGVWDPPGGLIFGRGSEAMRRDMLGRWMEAAVELGDVRAAKYANDYAIDLEAGGAYTSADAAAVMARASWNRRRARVLFAWLAVQTTLGRRVPEEHRARVEADRAAVLEDIGLEPARSNETLLGPLADHIGALIDEALGRDDIQPDPGLFMHHANLLVATRRPEEAKRTLRQGLRVHPRQPAIAEALTALERGPRRPR